jgi:L-alanine-DL-glutamate epimerase-like enolase superfamily enzyme
MPPKENESEYISPLSTMSDLRIESVQACLVRIPLSVTTSFVTRSVAAQDHASVKVRTAGGAEGLGFCYGGSSAGGLVVKAVRELPAPAIVGKDSFSVGKHWAMYREPLLREART